MGQGFGVYRIPTLPLWLGRLLSAAGLFGDEALGGPTQKPEACNYDLRSTNCGLLWGIVDCYFGQLGFPGCWL